MGSSASVPPLSLFAGWAARQQSCNIFLQTSQAGYEGCGNFWVRFFLD